MPVHLSDGWYPVIDGKVDLGQRSVNKAEAIMREGCHGTNQTEKKREATGLCGPLVADVQRGLRQGSLFGMESAPETEER